MALNVLEFTGLVWVGSLAAGFLGSLTGLGGGVIIVPLLGGGSGSKCDFHYEAHIAALARAAGRPVKLVFSRLHSQCGALQAVSPDSCTQ